MIQLTPYRNVEVISNYPSYKITIDTLRTTVYKRTFLNYAINQDFKVKLVKSHSKISARVKKLLWTKKVTGVKQIITPYFKNIIATTPHYLNQVADYKKCHLVAFGLSQYHKPLHVEAKEAIAPLFNKFGVDSYDLSIDMTTPLNPSLLSHFGEITSKYSTMYINNPLCFDSITKMCYYDKAQKDNLPYPIFRLELTIKTKGKLKEMAIPIDEIENVLQKIRTQK